MLKHFTQIAHLNRVSLLLWKSYVSSVRPKKFNGYQKSWNGSKKAKNDFLRGSSMRKLHQLTYSIDRNEI